MIVKLLGFWDGLYSSPFYYNFLKYFEDLFNHKEIIDRYHIVEVWACFNGPDKKLNDVDKNKNVSNEPMSAVLREVFASAIPTKN